MFTNRYIQRRVASTDSRPCFVCYKPTCSVMVHESQADFFYACDTHLNDPGFAVLDAASQEAERKRLEKKAEIENLRKEWEERSKKAAAGKDKPADAAQSDRAEALETLKDAGPASTPPEAPARKVYELNRGVLNLRFNAKRRVAQERRTKALLDTPGAFPKAPTHKPQ